ncbi:hypothetical protein [Bradyrhizobium archetypum]|uniref:Uncharacterized protein n=1 Tax=Bradyrhizobium archetypum TaxID=2721160 RepID=A0A7Y4H5P4_9BRAD|nr:hypothetical protein [Bradyrhizobium archetypum]NOJ48101.1 hypothetical protein [Bradyrhizobium archetypum]
MSEDDPIDDEWIDKVLAGDPFPIEEEEDEPIGRLLSDSELDAGQRLVIEWQSPQNFSDITNALCSRCKSAAFFNQPKLKYLHDAYVLAKFARLQNAESVRLAAASDQWPDGFIKFHGQIHNIEVTSTHGGRKLGEEYRNVTGSTLSMDPVENWVERANSIPKYLDEAIGNKAKRRYASPCWLVVYLNISEYGIRQKETEKTIAETKERHTSAFSAISVLWKGKLY